MTNDRSVYILPLVNNNYTCLLLVICIVWHYFLLGTISCFDNNGYGQKEVWESAITASPINKNPGNQSGVILSSGGVGCQGVRLGVNPFPK